MSDATQLDESTRGALVGILSAGAPLAESEMTGPVTAPDSPEAEGPAEEPKVTTAQPAGTLGKPETDTAIMLNDAQVDALTKFKELVGSGWKKALKACWETGEYPDETGENLRIALEQVKALSGGQIRPDEVAGDVSGKAKLRTEAKSKVDFAAIGREIWKRVTSDEMLRELSGMAGVDIVDDPEAYNGFWSELAGKFKSAGLLAKPKKEKSSKPKTEEPPEPKEEPAEFEEPEDDGPPPELGMPDFGGGGGDEGPSVVGGGGAREAVDDDLLDLAMDKGAEAAISEMMKKQ